MDCSTYERGAVVDKAAAAIGSRSPQPPVHELERFKWDAWWWRWIGLTDRWRVWSREHRAGNVGFDFRSLTARMNITTPSGEVLLQMPGALAKFERALIQERMQAALAVARRRERRCGRPAAIDTEKLRAMVAARDKWAAKAAAGRTLGSAHLLDPFARSTVGPLRKQKTQTPESFPQGSFISGRCRANLHVFIAARRTVLLNRLTPSMCVPRAQDSDLE